MVTDRWPHAGMSLSVFADCLFRAERAGYANRIGHCARVCAHVCVCACLCVCVCVCVRVC